MQVDFQGSPHFARAEMVCHCGCGQALIEPALIDALEALRAKTGPIRVNDAYRSPAHNAAVGGCTHSEHPLGAAADIVIEGKSLQQMYDLAESVDAFCKGGIGAYSGEDGTTPRIHVDVRPDGPARWGVKYGTTQITISDVVNDSPYRTRIF